MYSIKLRTFWHLLAMLYLAVTMVNCSGCSSDGGNSGASTVPAVVQPQDKPTEKPDEPDEPTPPQDVVIPPDPKSIAPLNNPTEQTNFSESIKFLFVADDAIQKELNTSAIDANSSAVLRGKVVDESNSSLSGVKISILHHPEFGYTISRDDGMFDMVVNASERMTVNYMKSGYLTIQRSLKVEKEDYSIVDSVVLKKLSTTVSEIDLEKETSAFAVVKGEVYSDSRGERKATVLLPKRTVISAKLADGTEKVLNGPLHLRATEYTVGESGPESMPAELPKGVAYTYCVEVSVDEAEALGATSVKFSEPVYDYVENFYGFPVGDRVPTYYYDKVSGEWNQTADGKVIAIVGIVDGEASIDLDGDGVADDTSTINMGSDERKKLATLYGEGTQLWRTALTHFTPIDHNWPEPPLPDDQDEPSTPPSVDDADDNPCETSGSIIEVQNRVLGERVPIVGTPFSLNYRSSRTAADMRNKRVIIPLIADKYSSSLEGILVEVYVAGQHIIKFFDTFEPNMSYTFVWNGKDAYGRDVYGNQKVNVKVTYSYFVPISDNNAQTAAGFRAAQPDIGTYLHYGPNHVFSINRWSGSFKNQIPTTLGAAGWSLSPVAFYDHYGKKLYEGDGSQHSVRNRSYGVINTVVGSGSTYGLGDGGSAIEASLNAPVEIDFSSDGSMYIVDNNHQRIRKVDSNNTITTVAGGGSSGDVNISALDARLYYPSDIIVNDDNSFYICDQANNRVVYVNASGVMTLVAGNGSQAFSGDNGDAKLAALAWPSHIEKSTDGGLYIADTRNNRIRKVESNGTIRTIAGYRNQGGYGTCGYNGDGGPSTNAQICTPRGMVVDKEGSLIFCDSDNHVIRKIDTDGVITTIAGSGEYGYSGDGGQAVDARLNYPSNIIIDDDGSLVFIDQRNVVIRKIDPYGTISTIAGTGEKGFSGDGGDALDARFNESLSGIFIKDNVLYIADTWNHRIRSIKGLTASASLNVLSGSGVEVYRFNNSHQLVQTVDALTVAPIYNFTYDENGYLTTISDAYNNQTQIEYNSDGNAIAITAPNLQRTVLAYDANGHLASITNPNAQKWQFSTTKSGLITAITKPNALTSMYEFDDNGALRKATNAEGGFKTFTQAQFMGNSDVNMSTKMGRLNQYKTHYIDSTRAVQTYIDAAGYVTDFNVTKDTLRSALLHKADGTTIRQISRANKLYTTSAHDTLRRLTITQPSGLSYEVDKYVDYAQTDSEDPLSMFEKNSTVSVNNQKYIQRYSKMTNTLTQSSPEGRTLIITLNDKGDIIKRVLGNIAAVDYSYNEKGKLSQISQGDRTISLAYDSNGYVASVTNALNQTTSFTYDSAGRVIKQTFADSREIAFTYDANGNLLSLTPPQKPSHNFSYTLVEQLANYTPPAVAGTGATGFSYNADKQLTKITRPDGKSIDLSYDSAGRLSTVEGINYAYNAMTGNIKTISNSDSETLTFDFDGSLLTQTTLSGTVAGSMAQTYNNDFRVTQRIINNANSIKYTYDKDGLITQAGMMAITRDSANGYITQSVLNTVTDARTLNSVAQMQRYLAENSTTTLFDVNYTYDKLSRITELAERVDGIFHSYEYSYDTAGRLSSVTEDGVTIGTYTYDENGNRLSANGVTATYDNQDRLQTFGSITYSYTANGELLTKVEGVNITSYTYDLLGNLKSVVLPNSTKIDYLVDGLNRRVGKKVNGTLVQGFLYKDALNPIAELDASNTVVSRFVYASKSHVPDYMMKGGTTYRIISDHLGSVRLVVNAADGTVVQRMDYDAWGNVTNDTNPGFQPFGFAGGLYDTDTKLTRFGARDYDAQSGRWTAKDPISFAGRDSNLYAYVANDPVNEMDSTGLSALGKIFDFAKMANNAKNNAKKIVDTVSSIAKEAVSLLSIFDSHQDGPSTFLDLIDNLIDFVPDNTMPPGSSDGVHSACEGVRHLRDDTFPDYFDRANAAYDSGN